MLKNISLKSSLHFKERHFSKEFVHYRTRTFVSEREDSFRYVFFRLQALKAGFSSRKNVALSLLLIRIFPSFALFLFFLFVRCVTISGN